MPAAMQHVMNSMFAKQMCEPPAVNAANTSMFIFAAFSYVVWTYVKQEAATRIYYSYTNLESFKGSGWLPRRVRGFGERSNFERGVTRHDGEATTSRTDFCLSVFRPSGVLRIDWILIGLSEESDAVSQHCEWQN
jgi:hypothetical protein